MQLSLESLLLQAALTGVPSTSGGRAGLEETSAASFTCLMLWLGWPEGRARLALCSGHRHVLCSMATLSVVRFLDLGLDLTVFISSL